MTEVFWLSGIFNNNKSHLGLEIKNNKFQTVGSILTALIFHSLLTILGLIAKYTYVFVIVDKLTSIMKL